MPTELEKPLRTLRATSLGVCLSAGSTALDLNACFIDAPYVFPFLAPLRETARPITGPDWSYLADDYFAARKLTVRVTSNIEAEIDYVAFLHDVVLAFESHQALFFSRNIGA